MTIIKTCGSLCGASIWHLPGALSMCAAGPKAARYLVSQPFQNLAGIRANYSSITVEHNGHISDAHNEWGCLGLDGLKGNPSAWDDS